MSELSYELKQGTLPTPNGRRTALLVVDVQNDFMENGTVPHRDTKSLIQNINTLRNSFRFNTVVLSQDCHPEKHISFISHHLSVKCIEPYETIDLDTTSYIPEPNTNSTPGGRRIVVKQTIFPTHCVVNSLGAAFPEDLQTHATDFILQKGTNPREDSPSLFYNDYSTKSELMSILSDHNISEVFIVGTAADTTVANTAIACATLGFQTYVVADCCSSLLHTPVPTSSSYDLCTATRSRLERWGVRVVNLTILREPRSDDGREVGAYLARHGITQLMQQLCAHLAYAQPADPIALLKAKLSELAESRLFSSLALLSDADIEVVFAMTDTNKEGWISGEQARKIVWDLGFDAELVRNQDRFTCAELKILVRRAMERNKSS